ncbi:hypothetical protein Nepgr_026008 [Nepenthes gracilis]|uniref:Uncharacterized protein n=1 Tax=Nepenthes gracilis TaxID=150966 RepID=A0AAD3Y1N4_NEPGR|nr:hypothetical protein Nepgr_026008 [Nepenthes gracilis]
MMAIASIGRAQPPPDSHPVPLPLALNSKAAPYPDFVIQLGRDKQSLGIRGRELRLNPVDVVLFHYRANSAYKMRFFRWAVLVKRLIMQTTLISQLIRTKKSNPFSFRMLPRGGRRCSLHSIVSEVKICIPPSHRLVRLWDSNSCLSTYYGFLVVLFIGYFIVCPSC